MILTILSMFLLVWFRALHDSKGNWTESDCAEGRRVGALWSGQVRACRRQPAAMTHVAAAARLARSACLATNAGDRWNCSSIELAPRFSPDLLTGVFIFEVIFVLFYKSDVTGLLIFLYIVLFSLLG